VDGEEGGCDGCVGAQQGDGVGARVGEELAVGGGEEQRGQRRRGVCVEEGVEALGKEEGGRRARGHGADGSARGARDGPRQCRCCCATEGDDVDGDGGGSDKSRGGTAQEVRGRARDGHKTLAVTLARAAGGEVRSVIDAGHANHAAIGRCGPPHRRIPISVSLDAFGHGSLHLASPKCRGASQHGQCTIDAASAAQCPALAIATAILK